MLEENKTRYNFIVLLLLTLAFNTACGKIYKPKPIELVAVPPEYHQVLIVRNETQNRVSVLPLTGSDAAPIAILPGESTRLDFTVKRFAKLDSSGTPRAESWTARIEGTPYLGMKAIDGILHIETVEGETWTYLIALGSCWFEDNPPQEEHELIIGEEEPAVGIPALRLCE
ncbi:MAG: hypothetical protein ACRENT_03160 [Thermodesulfobacteriota bacterium]